MSLPLRPALENVASVDRVLEDLLVRFIINCPPEDLSSVERELFHFEEASWFYTDFIKLMNPTLPSLKIKSFAQHVIKLCPLVWKWDIKADEALQKFSKYKKSIPVRGAAIFNQKLNKILLVQGTESDSWSFPRGKISKDEDDVACCIREVKEEIGFDLTDYIDEEQFIERNIQGKNYKIFIVKGVPEDFNFKPQVRNEIDKIEWRDFKKMSKTMYKSNVKYYLINSMMRPLSVWLRRQKHVKNDDQLIQYAEEQLKLLLGITKEENTDPGRDLLNMLHTAVQSKDEKIEPLQTLQNETAAMTAPVAPLQSPPVPYQQQHVPPLMGFQPFAPFPYVNGNLPFLNPQIVPSMGHPNGFMQMNNPEVNASTPEPSSLAKPVLAQEQASNGTSSSKQLLDLLNTKKTETPKVSILERPIEAGEKLDLDSNISDSQSLLNILKNPGQQNRLINEPKILPTRAVEEEASLKDELTDDAYEEFESSSDEEELQEKKSEESSDTHNDYDSSSEEEEEEQEEEEQVENIQREEPPVGLVNHDVLKENNFKPDEVPHVDEHSESIRSVDGTQLSADKTKPKPKFKLLRRGETLDDILPNEKTTKQPTELPQTQPVDANSPQSSNSLLELLKRPTNNTKPEPKWPQTIPDQKVSPEDELMAMINKGQRAGPAPEAPAEQGATGSAQLLSMLKKSKSKGTHDSPLVSDTGSQSASSDLLNILKRNPGPFHQSPNYQESGLVTPQQQILTDPFNSGPRQPASNELLHLLHRNR